MIEFDQDTCSNLEAALSREWLETNGIGGFACSTLAGANTRRYHALLTAATQPPVGRYVLLSKVEEALYINGVPYRLSTNEYAGAIYPEGYKHLTHFSLRPFPTWIFTVRGIELEKRVFMADGENTTVIQYRLIAPGDAPLNQLILELSPLIAFREYHSTTHSNNALDPTLTQSPGLISVTPYAGLPRMYFAHNAFGLDESNHWYFNFIYRVERERGLDFSEDLFNPFALRFDLLNDTSAVIIASTEIRDAAEVEALQLKELFRREGSVDDRVRKSDFAGALFRAADQYIVRRGQDKTIIAGYPWFSDWGRDTMVSLPGLTLVTGHYEAARDILRAFARVADQGMLPNRFPDAGEAPEYNTVDATLWFFEAIRQYLRYTGDLQFVRDHIYDLLRDIIDWHERATRHGIRVDEDGLLTCGEPGVQLTWMDANVGDWIVTPRYGRPVEIQALWYNALRVAQSLAERFVRPADVKHYRTLAARTQWRFNAAFWNDAAGCLYDVINGGQPDDSIRPNQIFALSLYHGMVPPERARSILGVVSRELLTPYGLRTLSRGHRDYVGHYGGNQRERDAAYHQGTVWPWLLGPYITAYVRTNKGSMRARREAGRLLLSLEHHLSQAGLGHISEIFDGDEPHRPNGCFAQAWSIAEILRALVEDIGLDVWQGVVASERAGATAAV